MLPSIYPGDYVLEDSIIGDLKYGDIVSFKYENKNGEFIESDVSRVIGLPGDSVGLVDNIVYINGKICDNKYIGKVEYHYEAYLEPFSFTEYEEVLVNNLSIKIYKSRFSGDRDNAIVQYVPAGHYYLLGDSRSMSIDSRFYGPIPKNRIDGKVIKIKSMQ